MRLELGFGILTNLLVTGIAFGKIYFEENFDDDSWSTRWAMSRYIKPGYRFGRFESTPGRFFANASNKGIRTAENGHLYEMAAQFPKLTNDNKTLVMQYSVKYENDISYDDCVGGYIRLFDCSIDTSYLFPEIAYLIKFGPDICGVDNLHNKLQITFRHSGKYYSIKGDISWTKDVYTHIYTLILKPNGTFQILVDGNSVQRGQLDSDFSFPLKRIKFPGFCGLGFNFWQSRSGTIFDNIILTDDVAVAAERRNVVLNGELSEKLMKAKQDDNQTEIRRLSEAIQRVEQERKSQEESLNSSCSSLLDLQCCLKGHGICNIISIQTAKDDYLIWIIVISGLIFFFTVVVTVIICRRRRRQGHHVKELELRPMVQQPQPQPPQVIIVVG